MLASFLCTEGGTKYNFSVIANNSQQIMGLGVTVFGCKCKWLMELLYELLQKWLIKI